MGWARRSLTASRRCQCGLDGEQASSKVEALRIAALARESSSRRADAVSSWPCDAVTLAGRAMSLLKGYDCSEAKARDHTRDGDVLNSSSTSRTWASGERFVPDTKERRTIDRGARVR